jgi:hemerythrin-like domain-containing protein
MPDYSSGSGSMARAWSLGAELVAVHQWLRAELARIRDDLDSHSGQSPAHGPLQVRCIDFCQALTNHHTSEDNTAFSVLADAFPELANVLDQLRQDHQLVAGVLRQLSEILATLTPDNSEQARREIDGLTAILESHFQWEERRLVAALDELNSTRTAAELFGTTAAGQTALP